MTMPVTLFRSRTRSLGLATLLGVAVSALAPVPGCLDETGAAPPGNECTASQVDDKDPSDCKQRICAGGNFADQPDDAEIPDDQNPCTLDVCLGGAAQHNPKLNGEACMLGGKAGTCALGQCEISCMGPSDCMDDNPCTSDACGADLKCAFTANDAAKPDDDGNPCTDEVCSNGVGSHPNSAPETSCGMSGKCDGTGSCAGCTSDTDCPMDTECADNFCETATKTCKSTAKPDVELPDLQLGDCKVPACVGGATAALPKDSDLPDDGKACTADSCSNGMPVSMSMGIGAACTTQDNPTGVGKCDSMDNCLGCTQPANCPAGYTCGQDNKCASCMNGQKDGAETDTDCGNGCINDCVTGQMCNQTSDCVGECDTGVCVDCFDGAKNGTEGDVDCGGICMQKCSTNQGCNVGLDCANGVCNGNKCAAPTCMDGVKNGSESDKDCGQSCATKCIAGQMCKVKQDCAAMLDCLSGTCG